VLDINGHTVQSNCSSGASSALITNYGTLKVKDRTDTSGDSTGSGNLINNYGTLTFKSGY